MKDGLSIKLRGGDKLERKLNALPKRVATSFVKRSLTSAAVAVKKEIKVNTPKAQKDTKGFKNESRNIKKGQLRRSLKSGLRNRVGVPRDVFLAGVWFSEGDKNDGFFAKFLLNKHKKNAFGFSGGSNFLSGAVKKAKSPFVKTVGVGISTKIVKFANKELNK